MPHPPSYNNLTRNRSSYGESVTTSGLSTMPGRVVLALGEAVLFRTRQILGRRLSTSSLVSETSEDHRSYISDTETYSSSSTVPGPGALSGKAIKALGKLTLRGLDEIQLRLRLNKLRPFFPHGNRVFWEPDDGEEMYEELLDLSRPGLYSTQIRKTALSLLLTQIGFREVTQLIKGLSGWDAESIVQLLYSLMDVALRSGRSLTKAYLLFQDAPQMDPILPFATFLQQLSTASHTGLHASQAAASILLSRLPSRTELSLTNHLLQILSSRNPFEDDQKHLREALLLPDDIRQWKFSWLLSCVAWEGEYWDLLIKALSRSDGATQCSMIARTIDCVLRTPMSHSSTVEPINLHLLDSFYLACRQGSKRDSFTGKDPTNLMLKFLFRAITDDPNLRLSFVHPNQFLLAIQNCLSLDIEPQPKSADEVLLVIVEYVQDGYLTNGVMDWHVERVRLCWEIYKLIVVYQPEY